MSTHPINLSPNINMKNRRLLMKIVLLMQCYLIIYTINKNRRLLTTTVLLIYAHLINLSLAVENRRQLMKIVLLMYSNHSYYKCIEI